jgi:hypothetical protein
MGGVWAAREYLNPSRSSPAAASLAPFENPASGAQPQVQRCRASPRHAMATQLRNHADQGFAQIAQVIGAAHLAQANPHDLAVGGGNVAEYDQAPLAEGRDIERSAGRGDGCWRERCRGRSRESGWSVKRHDEIYFRGMSVGRLPFASSCDTSAGALGAGATAIFQPAPAGGTGRHSAVRGSASHVAHCPAVVSRGSRPWDMCPCARSPLRHQTSAHCARPRL